MHKSDNNDNNNKDTSKMQYFAAMHDCSCLFLLKKVDPDYEQNVDPDRVHQFLFQMYC